MTGVGALVAVVANPLAGAFSDRTTSRFGRRRPWVLGGAAVGALAIVLLPTQGTILGVALLWGCGQAAVNSSYAAITATIPDQVPVEQRGVASGLVGLSQTLGVVLGVALVSFAVTGLAPGAWVTALLAFALVIPFLLRLHDPVLVRELRPAFRLGEFLRGFWVSPRLHPDFAWAWITRFLISLSNAMATLYLLFFLKDQVHYADPEQGQTILIAIYAVGTMATAVIGGRMSDRSGRRKIYVIVSSVVMAVSGVMLAGLPTFAWCMVAAGDPRRGLRRLPRGRPGPHHPGASDRLRPRSRPRGHQRRQLVAPGARTGDRGPDRDDLRRLSRALRRHGGDRPALGGPGDPHQERPLRTTAVGQALTASTISRWLSAADDGGAQPCASRRRTRSTTSSVMNAAGGASIPA